MTIDTKSTDVRPVGESCVGCEYAGGIVLHYCTHPQSEFFRGLVAWDGWCPQFVPRKETEAETQQ
jgi:hypothetical protein